MSSDLQTKKEVARELKVSMRCLENWMSSRRIAYVKCGTAVRFTREAVDAFKKAHTVESIPQ
jgi:excisionase family DNA binding protein